MAHNIGANQPDITPFMHSSKTKPGWWLPPKWLRLLIVAILLLGIFFRFANLDKKIYAVDETYTSLRISGYTEAELVQQVGSQIIDIKDLQKYQRINPEKNVGDTIKGLAKEEPQLTPLYFVLTRFWVQAFGDSVALTRSFSAFISLFALPCIYWLCLELFQSSLTGWIAIALIAVSPFHVLYAQEARPYSLWSVTILLASVTLLRAMRLNTLRSWCIYAVTVAIGLYSFLYFGLVALAHGVYVVATKGWRGKKTIMAYLFASIAGILAFLPWIVAMITNVTSLEQKTSWQAEAKQPLSFLMRMGIVNFSRNFIDFDLKSESALIELIVFAVITLILLFLVSYAIYFLCRHTPKTAWLFVLSLTLIPTLFLVLPDIISGGIRSTHGRYLIPFYLGIQIAVAYLFANKINISFKNILPRQVWQVALISLLSIGIGSCAVSSQAPTWWSKYTSSENLSLASVINSSPKPLLLSAIDLNFISYTDIGNLLCLSYILQPKVKAQIVVEPNTPEISKQFSDVFLVGFFNSASDVLNRIEKKRNLKIAPVLQQGITKLYKL